MEDDDEFGDLYTDVLQPLTTSSAPTQPPVQPTPPPHPPSRSIDLNNSIPSDDEEILYGAPSSSKLSFGQPDSNTNLNKTDGVSGKTGKNLEVADSGARVFGSSSSVLKVEDKGFAEDPSFLDDCKGGFSQVKEEALEGNFGIEDAGQEDEFLIPGLSSSGARVLDRGGGEGEGGDDWDDSDSEDDLQIVLNDNNEDGTMGMNRGGGGDEEDDEDGDNLVIVADNNDPNFHHQQAEELQEWGDDSNQPPEGGGERKDLLGGDVGKVDRGAAMAPKTGYNSHGYHPFHSQFKYVRPGAAPMPGAAPETTGGTTGQVRPPANMLPFAGRGRGDWRPMQKNFHQGYGTPGWGNNGAARGFGCGLDFTLPSHKTIFEVDIDGFEEKPWRLQGIDMSDFFNFGLNEESWKEYCKQLEQLRLESTMQSKIRVYESGRTEQEYDPDLPPELAAAAGIHDGPSENHIIGKSDMHSDLAKGSQRARMQLPTGRAIQVETGFGERLPSIDTRPPRVRDSDAIIEIVLQESADDESAPGNDGAEQLGDDPSKENHREGLQENDITTEDNHFDKIPQDYNGGKGEHFGRRAPLMGSVLDKTAAGDRVSQFSDTQDHLDSRGKTSSYSSKKLSSHNHMERRAKRRAPDRSPRLTDSGSLHDKKLVDNEKEESTESVGGKQSPTSSREERDLGQNDVLQDEVVAADGSSGMGKEETALDTAPVDTFKDEKQTRNMNKQKLVTRAERSSVEKVDEGEETKAARSSENSKARSRSGSSRDQRNMRDSVEEEVIQTGGSVRGGNFRPPLNEDERHVRSRSHDERKERERRQSSMKGTEDLSSRKKWDPNLEYHPHVKPENLDRRKGRGYEGVWQDEDPHGGRMRTEDMRKRNHSEEMVSRHRHKVREIERIDKDEHRSKNDSWKGDYDRDVASQQNMDDSLRTRHNSSDNIHSKRRKEEVHARRGDLAEREEALRIHRESTSRRKRERDDNLDQHKRDEQARLKEDDQHSFRHKEEGWLQRERIEKPRERDDWKEREGHRGVRSGRAVDDKSWAGHSRLKEEYRNPEREYPFKETVREQPSRRDRVENESLSRHRGHEDTYVHGNKVNNDERISKQERGYTGTDAHRAQEKKHKESVRKGKESDVATHNSLAPSRRNREDHNSLRTDRVSSRATVEQRRDEQNPTARQSSKRRKEDASSEDEQQDLRRGRSKLERWTSHKEKDFTLDVVKPPPAPLNVKEPDRHDDDDDNGPSSTSKPPPVELPKPEETVKKSNPSAELPKSDETVKKPKPPAAEENDDAKPAEVKHLDTVEKLKKRSERFKLPMPSEKEAVAIKKMENEALPETRPDSEVKPERPPRKRRWTSG